MASEHRRFEEKEVAEVLRRASELDALRQNSMTISDIRSIAEELGTSQWAVDQAITELGTIAAEQSRNQRNWRDRIGSWKALPTLSALQGLAVGAAIIGMDARTGGTAATGEFGVILTAVASLVLANVVGGKNRHEVFQKSNLALWGAFALATSLAWPSEIDNIVMIVSMCMASSAALGAIMTEWHHRQISRGEGPGSRESKTTRVLIRIGNRVKEWAQKMDMQFIGQSKGVSCGQSLS